MTHPITPPPELVQQWVAEIWHEGTPVRVALSDEHIATRAAQWGSDQELEACCHLLKKQGFDFVEDLRAARRPKPPSLKEQALAALSEADQGLNKSEWQQCSNTIRRALEQLDD
jgi:hypothetical protein